MEILSPEVKKFVDDYDFVFEAGILFPVTIDQSNGDRLQLGEEVVLVYLSPKPTKSDPTVLSPAQDITIFKKHLLSVQHTQREVMSEQRATWVPNPGTTH
jgi:hypothetical protein